MAPPIGCLSVTCSDRLSLVPQKHVVGIDQCIFTLSQFCVMQCFHFFLVLGDFRLFCGDLGNEVTDEYLFRAFAKYPSVLKAKVVRDKKTKKTKGYGFVSFKDPQDYLRAMREMNGESFLMVLSDFFIYAIENADTHR